MSAFLISTQTINQIVAGISTLVKQRNTSPIPARLAEVGFDTNQAGWEEQVAKALFALNAQAVAQRYQEPAAKGFQYTRVAWLPNRYQLLKSINCWLYQCAEGNVPNRPLYQFFEGVVVRWLLECIVYTSPQYEAAKWE